MDAKLANLISKVCLAKFNSLPKTGKPKAEYEWSILSAIVLVDAAKAGDPTVVSLGTGTKCLGADQLSEKGDILNDSHAEVMARRGFLRFLMQQMTSALKNGTSIFELNSESRKFSCKSGISFHFFTTHSPCGDASIYSETSRSSDEPSPKRVKLSAEGMTGGKLLSPSASDAMAQDVGKVRTKPGKGVRTLSLSCSDKMARWAILGVQGSLLMMLLDRPIYLESVVICDGTDFCNEAIERALWKRWDPDVVEGALREPFRQVKPTIVAASNGLMFQFRKNRPVCGGGKFQPAPGGIVWCSDVERNALEVEIGGRRQGVTKKMLATPAARLKISKIELFATFAAVWKAVTAAGSGADMDTLRYVDVKNRSRAYREQWDALRVAVFPEWSAKPSSLLTFDLCSGGK
ncbi:tRNA-specific adenosine deaminase 1 [Culex quinquefasciatus]|uniref:tRNA-specific adenosine deaminase 1 n=1 Tax=Culex quinquefasciatus TaxID=7176 RepID=UPI0018E2AA0F|nr:tRNA-specific adenosine deaminase 1 [Culex quinquefasciatus]